MSKIIYNKIIPIKGFSAINIFGIIFARVPLNDYIIRHEKIHTAQIKELLYIGFYIWYIFEYIIKYFKYNTNAYYKISFEREAYDNQYDNNYLLNRKHYNFLKYI